MSAIIAFPRIPPDLFQKLQATRATLLLLTARMLEYQKQLVGTTSLMGGPTTRLPIDERPSTGTTAGENNNPWNDRNIRLTTSGPARREDADCLTAILTLYLRDVEIINELRRIVGDERASIDAKLRRLDEVLPLPDGITATELARAFNVSRQAISKTTWWRGRLRSIHGHDAHERFKKLSVKGRGIAPHTYDSFDDNDMTAAG